MKRWCESNLKNQIIRLITSNPAVGETDLTNQTKKCNNEEVSNTKQFILNKLFKKSQTRNLDPKIEHIKID